MTLRPLHIAATAALLTIAVPAMAAADASPSFNCDGPGANFQTKIDGAADGATIYFGGACDDGPYRIAGKNIHLRGFSSGGTLSAPGGGECVVEISFAQARFSRMAIDASGAAAGICVHFARVDIDGSQGFTISDSLGNGITAIGGSTVLVRGAQISNSAAHGILLAGGSSGEIVGNLVAASGDIGINLDTGSHAFIGQTEIVDSGTSGIWIQMSSGAEIAGSHIAGSQDHGIGAVSSSAARLSDNTIEFNGIAGVTVDRNASIRLSGVNLIQANNFGLLCGRSGSLEESDAQDFGLGNAFGDVSTDPDCHYP